MLDRLQRFRKRALAEIAAGDSDAQAIDAARQMRQRRFGRAVRAAGVGRIVALHRVVAEREIAGAARERTEMIEADHERKAARARQPAIGRLQPEDAAERRRHPDRTVGVGAERQRHQPAADRRARAAGRTAGHAGHVMRIARGAVMHILAGEVVGVFAHVERADQDGAGGFQLFDQRRVMLRRRQVAIDLRSGAGRKALRRRTGS